jgi:hypothetical protein
MAKKGDQKMTFTKSGICLKFYIANNLIHQFIIQKRLRPFIAKLQP